MAHLQHFSRTEALGTEDAAKARGESFLLWAILAAAFCAATWTVGLYAFVTVVGWEISQTALTVTGLGIFAFLACICIALMKNRD